MRLINADMVVHWETYNDEYESFERHTGTVAELLDAITEEGCPEYMGEVTDIKKAFEELERESMYGKDGEKYNRLS